MKTRISCLFLFLAFSSGIAIAAEEMTVEVSAGTAMTPAVPVTPGRPHARSYDPQVKLGPETQIRIALQHKAEGRPQEALHTLSQASVQVALGEKDAAIRDLERFLQISDNLDWNRQAKELMQVLKDPDSAPEAPPPSPHR